MEELLKEVVLSERRKRQIDAFVQTVTELLRTVPRSSEVEVGAQPCCIFFFLLLLSVTPRVLR